jgi:hypothetical protein
VVTVLLGLALLIALGLWLFGPARRRAVPPEDDIESPLDQEALAEAQSELEEDPDARALQDGFDDEETDDWGPGVR